MATDINLKKIKNIVKEFFDKMGFDVEVEAKAFEENTLPIDVQIEDPKILIGEGGKTLAEIQHLLKAILMKEIKSPFFFHLDINDYKKKKYQYLRELAKSVADEVALTKKERALFPMPAAERRIIHLELAERQDVVSESIDQGFERRIVIKPHP